MATVELTRDNFEETVTKNDIVIVDFWASWCGPCQGFAPVFEAASDKYGGIVFGKVNSDDQQELAMAFNVRSIPFLMVFREKIILYAEAGAMPQSGLESIIEQARALDMEKVRKDIAERQAKEEQQQ
jgi:thioredoxin 1